MTTQKELNEKLIENLKSWQNVEDSSVSSTTEIISKTGNPIVRTIMEIIRQDSAMHRRVQQLMIDHFEKEAISLTPDELADIWDLVENHIKLEQETIRLADEARKNSKNFVIRYLLNYLLTDETKHNEILLQLEDFKAGMYPYA